MSKKSNNKNIKELDPIMRTLYENFFNREWKFKQTIKQRIIAKFTKVYKFNIIGFKFPIIRSMHCDIIETSYAWQPTIILNDNLKLIWAWENKTSYFYLLKKMIGL